MPPNQSPASAYIPRALGQAGGAGFSASFTLTGCAARKLISSGKDGAVHLWSPAGLKSSQELLSVAARQGAWDVSPDGTTLAVVDSGTVCLHDIASGEKRPLTALGTNIDTLFWSPDGEILAGIKNPPEVRIWNLAIAKLTRHPLSVAGTPVHWLFLPKSQTLLIGYTNSERTSWAFCPWDIRTRKAGPPVKVPKDVGATTVSADERWLIIGTSRAQRGQVAFVDLQTGAVREFQPHPQIIPGLAISPNGELLATADLDEPTIKLWGRDLERWKPLASVQAHNFVVRSIVFSPDASRMATTSIGREPIKIWDTSTWQEVATVGIADTSFFGPRFISNGNILAALDTHRKLHLWRAPSWSEIEATESNRQEGQNQ